MAQVSADDWPYLPRNIYVAHTPLRPFVEHLADRPPPAGLPHSPVCGSRCRNAECRTRVIDGDTIDVGGIRVRLQDFAAPEMREPGGQEAEAYLAELAQGWIAVCDLTSEGTCGRRVGTCRVDDEDLAGQVIKAGLAQDCPRYGKGRYVGVEQEAASLPMPNYCRPRRR